jgi:glyoxylase-like metal-dependent hydrolase (beta-lactamase superfamily II)
VLETRPYGDVLQIRLSQTFNGQPLYWVAAYLVDGLLVDSGCEHTADELTEFLSNYPLEQIVNTHYHEDHIGANARLFRQRRPSIYAHRDSIPLMQQTPVLFPYQEVAWGYPQPCQAQELGTTIKTKSHTFQVLPTPGHCTGHVALLEKEQGWCFSGDLFVSERPKVLRPEENIYQIMKSLHLLLDSAGADFTLFTSIGAVVENGAEAVNNLLIYLEKTIAIIIDYDRRGYTIDKIRQELFGGESRMAGISNGQFSVDNLINSALSHSAS